MMSDRPHIELNTVQVVASVLAAVTGAVLTSYLGVGGTVVGTAVGSIATTSGFAIYKHYLGRTKERIDHVAPVIVEHARVWTPTSGYPTSRAAHHGNGAALRSANGSPASAGSGRPEDQQTQPMQAWDPGRPGAQSAGEEAGPPAQPSGTPGPSGPGQPGAGQPGAGEPGSGQPDSGQPGSGQPGAGQPGAGQPGAGEPPREFGTVRMAGNGDGGGAANGATPGTARDGEGGDNAPGNGNGNGNGNQPRGGILRGRPRWVGVAATSAAVFVLVIVAITVFELATGKPLAATVRGQQGSGTTLSGGSAGSSGHGTPQPTQSATPSQSATSPSTGQTAPQPSSGSSTSPAPSSVPSPSVAPSVKATPPAPSAPVRGVPPSG
jgi:hypothetical protein